MPMENSPFWRCCADKAQYHTQAIFYIRVIACVIVIDKVARHYHNGGLGGR
ncbi:hypothetical protein [Ostreibacterium oceani]|uniref:hypothetical protein n=1 Tax=Ostreibacterium oceani TaxID=2654998 RepID=UPI001C407B2A|nr:hypothetical protein [Ostreibacterium oceani]